MPGSQSPGFSPPRWPRFGTAPAAPAVGGLAPLPVEIPYLWISPGVQWRSDRPYTSAAVSQTGGATAYDSNPASYGEYGDNLFSATLDTALAADPAALASMAMDYYATQPGAVPRQRFVTLLLVLNNRTVAEQQRILAIDKGQRIVVTGPPATWPQGLYSQIVEGITHSIGAEARVVALITSPVIGTTPGVPGPWFRLGTSALGGTDVSPF